MKNIFQSETMSAFRDWQPNRFYRILIAVAVWEFAALVTTIIWRSMARPLDTLPWETVFIVKTLVWQIWGLIVPLILAVARRYFIANTTNKIKNLTILIIMSIIILTVYGVVYVATLEFYFIGKIMLRWTINYGQTFLTLHILYFFFGIWLLFLLEHIFSYTRHIRELSIRAVQGKYYLYATTLAGLENVLGEKFLRIRLETDGWN